MRVLLMAQDTSLRRNFGKILFAHGNTAWLSSSVRNTELLWAKHQPDTVVVMAVPESEAWLQSLESRRDQLPDTRLVVVFGKHSGFDPTSLLRQGDTVLRSEAEPMAQYQQLVRGSVLQYR